MEWHGQQVHFRICDIYHPEPTQVLLDRYGDVLLIGTVIDVSDSGRPDEVFVVVEVVGMTAPLIVPVEHLRRPQ